MDYTFYCIGSNNGVPDIQIGDSKLALVSFQCNWHTYTDTVDEVKEAYASGYLSKPPECKLRVFKLNMKTGLATEVFHQPPKTPSFWDDQIDYFGYKEKG